MDLQSWVEEHGDEALRRAMSEGYQVRRGAGLQMFAALEVLLPMKLMGSWDNVEERTSPHSRSFELRDEVKRFCGMVPMPDGWNFDVGRISRVTVDGEPCTGVLIRLLDEHHKVIAARVADFESAGDL